MTLSFFKECCAHSNNLICLYSGSVCSNTPSAPQISLPVASKGMRKSFMPGKRFLNGTITLSSQLNSTSRNGEYQLQILNQPEQQHRARYQTEGSRGAVKDRTGNSFPVVKVCFITFIIGCYLTSSVVHTLSK